MNMLELVIVFTLASLLVYNVALADSPQEIVAACLVLEAGGEVDGGMLAVMNVIQNRAKKKRMTFMEVVLERKQFSCFNSGIKLAVIRARVHPKFENALFLVERASQGRLSDITLGADHYYAPKKCSPIWAKDMVETCVVGRHRFLRSK